MTEERKSADESDEVSGCDTSVEPERRDGVEVWGPQTGKVRFCLRDTQGVMGLRR